MGGGLSCVFCSPVFILSLHCGQLRVGCGVFLNGNISMLMLFALKVA